MANGADIAKAYVQIIPSADGIKGQLTELMGGEAEKAGKSSGGKLGKALGKGLKAVAKVGVAATGIAATGIAALTKSAISAYADYEQLVGGVETLFGAGGQSLQEYAQSVGKSTSLVADEYAAMMTAQNTVLSNAAEAYKTAGMSQNEYMETVTSFSASLIGSLEGDTLAAAKAADLAIRDMSDNANKMGTDMGAIQTAYQGFAKQNYTMLDNLKLGYGGTKSEMERLLKDATALSGVEYDIDNLADVYSAIHVIQDELGITGTTAREASTTIAGSIGMMKSSWENLIAGFGNGDADMEKLFGDLVSSAETVLGNLIPVAEKALGGIADAIGRLAPVIAEKLPGLVEQVLPPLLSAATTLITALAENLPTILNVLIEALPEIITSVTTALADAAPQMVEVAIILIIALMNGLIQAIPILVEKVPEIVKAIWETIKEHAPEMLDAASTLINTLLAGIGQLFGPILQKGREILNKIGEGFKNAASAVASWGKSVIDKIVSGIRGAISSVINIGRNIVEGIWNGISNGLGWIKNKITGWVGNVMSFLKSLFGIKSPSTWARDEIGFNIAAGVGLGFEDGMKDVEKAMQASIPTVGDLMGNTNFAGAYNYGSLAPAYNYGGVTIQILGREKDAEQLAIELQNALVRRAAVWA